MIRIKDESIDIKHLKPVMKALVSLAQTTIEQGTVESAKADGEFTYINYDRDGKTYCANKWQRKTTDFPALNELIVALNKTSVQKAELLAEFYAMENGRPVNLPTFIHFLKNGNPAFYDNLYLGIFEVISINGQQIREPYHLKLAEADNWFKGLKHVHVLPWQIVNDIVEAETFWQRHVQKGGYEGVIIHNSLDTFKLKPLLDLDAVIIGINKQNKGFKENTVSSLKLALRNENGTFVEIGDVTVVQKPALGKNLWKLMEYRVGEDNETVFVQPKVVVKIKFNAVYRNTRNSVFSFEAFKKVGTQTLIRLRHPEFVDFRADKTTTSQDIGLSQVPAGDNDNGCVD